MWGAAARETRLPAAGAQNVASACPHSECLFARCRPCLIRRCMFALTRGAARHLTALTPSMMMSALPALHPHVVHKQARRRGGGPKLAILCLMFVRLYKLADGGIQVGRRHPDDVAVAVRFHTPRCVAGRATELNISVAGLVRGRMCRCLCPFQPSRQAPQR